MVRKEVKEIISDIDSQAKDESMYTVDNNGYEQDVRDADEIVLDIYKQGYKMLQDEYPSSWWTFEHYLDDTGYNNCYDYILNIVEEKGLDKTKFTKDIYEKIVDEEYRNLFEELESLTNYLEDDVEKRVFKEVIIDGWRIAELTH